MKTRIELIYEDPFVVVVNKPAGVLSIPDRFDSGKPNLQALLQETYGKIWTVHRLDRETSGAILFARTEEAHRNLNAQFEARTVDKIYLALTDGNIYTDEGVMDKSIAPHPSQAGKMMTASHGKQALTLYRVVERFRSFTLAEANIKTGRTHQVRVHFQSIGHPLAVDPLYGKRESLSVSEIKVRNFNLGKFEEEKPLMSRVTLHAAKLSFDHPDTGARITLEAPLHKDFQAVLNQLRKWGK
mgnify:CR=1 FL=1